MDDRDAEARRTAALNKLLHARGGTFKEKVAFVREKMPHISDPEGFVAAVLRKSGEIP